MPLIEKPPALIRKLDHTGTETWRYPGWILERGSHFIKLEAFFNRKDLPFHEIVLRENDRFIETYFDDRWHNIFEIYDKENGQFKAWYCNISYPAMIEEASVSYRDLALDLLVYPDGRQLVLDEDEFTALSLPPDVQEQARAALKTLQQFFRMKFENNEPR